MVAFTLITRGTILHGPGLTRKGYRGKRQEEAAPGSVLLVFKKEMPCVETAM